MNSPNPDLNLAPNPPSRPTPRRRPDDPPALVLAPLAYLKLQFCLHAGDTEVGGFGVSRAGDPLYVEDFVTVVQATTCVTVAFDDAAVADHFDAMADAGRPPAECGRIWVHTHPGASPLPTGTDEETFARVFGRCDWSVMFIIARSGQTYARLRFAAGPTAAVLLPVRVDWATWATALADLGGDGLGELAEAWMDEYGRNVRPVTEVPPGWRMGRLGSMLLTGGALLSDGEAGDGHLFDDRDVISDPDVDWWEIEDDLAALAEMESADYWAGREVFP